MTAPPLSCAIQIGEQWRKKRGIFSQLRDFQSSRLSFAIDDVYSRIRQRFSMSLRIETSRIIQLVSLIMKTFGSARSFRLPMTRCCVWLWRILEIVTRNMSSFCIVIIWDCKSIWIFREYLISKECNLFVLASLCIWFLYQILIYIYRGNAYPVVIIRISNFDN